MDAIKNGTKPNVGVIKIRALTQKQTNPSVLILLSTSRIVKPNMGVIKNATLTQKQQTLLY